MRGGPSSPKQARTPTCRSRAVRCFSLCFGHDGRWCLHAAQEYKGYSCQDWQLGRQSTCVLATNRTCEPQSAAPLVLRAVFTQSCYARVPAAAQTRLSRILRCPLHLPPSHHPSSHTLPGALTFDSLSCSWLVGNCYCRLFFLSSLLPCPATPSRIGFPARPKLPSLVLRVLTCQPRVHLVTLQTSFV